MDELAPGVYERRLAEEGILDPGSLAVPEITAETRELRDQAVRFYELAVRRGTNHATTVVRLAEEHGSTWVAASLTGFQEHAFREELSRVGVSVLEATPNLEVRRREPGNLFQIRYNRPIDAAAAGGNDGVQGQLEALLQQILGLQQEETLPEPAVFDDEVRAEVDRRLEEVQQLPEIRTTDSVRRGIQLLHQAERLCRAPDTPHV